MKYRIVQYKNNLFGIQHKRLLWWIDEKHERFQHTISFKTIKEAEMYLTEKHSGTFTIMRVIRIWR